MVSMNVGRPGCKMMFSAIDFLNTLILLISVMGYIGSYFDAQKSLDCRGKKEQKRSCFLIIKKHNAYYVN